MMQQVPGTTMPQQLAQQAAAGGRPALIALPGQPGQQFLLNPALGQQQANLQAMYAQQLQAMQAMQAQQAARPQLAGAQAGPAVRSASPAAQQQPQQVPSSAQSVASATGQQHARPSMPMVRSAGQPARHVMGCGC